MKTTFQKKHVLATQMLFGVGFLLLLVAWSPPTNDPGILVTGNTIQVRKAGDSEANTTSTSAAVIVGTNNDITNNNSASDRGRGLIVGSTNKFVCPEGYGAVIGNSNEVKGRSLMVVGSTNKVSTTAVSDATAANFSIVGGSGNQVNKDSTSSLVAGKDNTVYGDNTFASGFNNTVGGPLVNPNSTLPQPKAETSTFSSAGIGYLNLVAADHGWAIGYSNTVSGNNGVAIGTGAISSQEDSTALGRYNQQMVAGDVLVIGAGSNANNRFTALKVTSGGSVVLGAAQGDISMGAYQ